MRDLPPGELTTLINNHPMNRNQFYLPPAALGPDCVKTPM